MRGNCRRCNDLLGTLLASGVVQGTLQQPRTSFVADAKGLGLTSGKRPAADSAIHASGEVGLTGPKKEAELKVAGSLQKINPAAFGAALPNGNVNADFTGSGRLTSDWQVALNLGLRESTLQTPGRLRQAVGECQTRRECRYGIAPGAEQPASEGRAGWRHRQADVETRCAATVDPRPRFAGVLQASGSVSGKMDAPAAQLSLDGRDLTLATSN